MIVTYHPDGTTSANPSGAPTAWLPDGTPFRVAMRFIQADEGLIAYNGIPNVCATYTAVVARWADYNAMLTDSALAANVDVDIACVVTGNQIRNGRSGLFTEIEAATLDLSIFDEVGLFDPRLSDTVLGPGRRVRTGTWVQVSVLLTGGWFPMFTGMVDSWARNIDAEQPTTRDPNVPVSDVSVQCTDAFANLGASVFNGAVVQQLTSERVAMFLADAWQPVWGGQVIATGTINLDARTLDDSGILDEIKAAAAVEDGRVFIARDGTFTFQTGAWRAPRNAKLTVMGVGASDFRGQLFVCTYQRVATTTPSYTDLKAQFLVYDDMRVCSGTGAVAPLPQVCASKMAAADTADDVVNEVVLSYTSPSAPTGYVRNTRQAVVSTPPVNYRARDDASIKRYGLRSVNRSDMTPTPHTVLNNLGTTLVKRWRGGDATITAVSVDLNAEPLGHPALFALWSGDLINVVDRVPAAAMTTNTDEWMITTAEIAGMTWNLTPERVDVELVLDEISAA